MMCKKKPEALFFFLILDILKIVLWASLVVCIDSNFKTGCLLILGKPTSYSVTVPL